MDRIRLQVALDVWTAYQNCSLPRKTAHHGGFAEQCGTIGARSPRPIQGRVGIMLDLLNAQTT